MFRQTVLSAVSAAMLVACAGVHALAAERATFILTDGERKSGPVVYHGDQHENLINGYLNLGVDNGKDMTFPLDQVAVIDFVGGQPPTTELAQLGAGHMLVKRTGATEQGRLVNLIGGDTLVWENATGQRQQYAIREVSRIYLNPASARTAFGYIAPVTPAATAPVATPTARNPASPIAQGNQGEGRNQGNGAGEGNQRGQGNQGNQGRQGNQGNQGNQDSQGNRRGRSDGNASTRGVTVRMDPRQGWTDSGLTVNRGDRLVFETSMPTRGLVGRIGDGAPFSIGPGQDPIVMRSAGALMLGVSDEERRGDRAAFSVTVSRP
jgi:hypothetical protein